MEYSNSRNPYHDYTSKSIYLVTINKGEGIPDFSRCYDDPSHMNRRYPGVVASDVGEAIKNGLRKIEEKFPFTRKNSYIIMPDHVHFILEYLEDADVKLGDIIANFKTGIRHELKLPGVFAPGFHDRILRHKGQLNRMRNYVMDNPRRRVIMRNNKEYFGRPQILNLWGEEYTVYGNFLLLRDPVISTVRESSKFSDKQRKALRAEWDETIRSNGVLVSPFIHPAENEIRKKGMEGGASIIHIIRDEIGERYKPSGVEFDLCAEGRLLIISTEKAKWQPDLSKNEAMAMNDLAARLGSKTLPPLLLRKKEFGRKQPPGREAMKPG